ncbi:MAG: hypothetical protein M1833_003472 [Piccolia ochrophora]|nr:MAG: hypothetical protein M1833_003472 [Piccolia ochrophora]
MALVNVFIDIYLQNLHSHSNEVSAFPASTDTTQHHRGRNTMCHQIITTFKVCKHEEPILITCPKESESHAPCAPLASAEHEEQDGTCFTCQAAADPDLQRREAQRTAPPVYYLQAMRFVGCGHTSDPMETELRRDPEDEGEVLFEDFEGECWTCDDGGGKGRFTGEDEWEDGNLGSEGRNWGKELGKEDEEEDLGSEDEEGKGRDKGKGRAREDDDSF